MEVKEVKTRRLTRKEVKIRRLTRKDRKRFSKLIVKLTEITGSEDLINMVPSSNEDSSEDESSKSEQTANTLQFAFNLLEGFLKFIEEDVTEWFMDLVSITDQAEYDNLDFDIEVEIISQITLSKGFEGFFLKGLQAVKRMKSLTSPLKK